MEKPYSNQVSPKAINRVPFANVLSDLAIMPFLIVFEWILWKRHNFLEIYVIDYVFLNRFCESFTFAWIVCVNQMTFSKDPSLIWHSQNRVAFNDGTHRNNGVQRQCSRNRRHSTTTHRHDGVQQRWSRKRRHLTITVTDTTAFSGSVHGLGSVHRNEGVHGTSSVHCHMMLFDWNLDFNQNQFWTKSIPVWIHLTNMKRFSKIIVWF